MIEIQYRTEFGKLLEHLGLTGHGIEIGCAECRNAQVLISQPSITKLYMIDAWTHLEQAGDGGHPEYWHSNNLVECYERIEPWKEKAVVMRGLSQDMIKLIPDDSLIFGYIDCDHSYNGFSRDLYAIYKKVKVGGVIAGHDVLNPSYGVGRALRDWIVQNGYFPYDIHYTVENGDESMVSFWFIKK